MKKNKNYLMYYNNNNFYLKPNIILMEWNGIGLDWIGLDESSKMKS